MSTIKVENIRIASEAVSRPVTGVAAAWVNFNGTGTVAIRGSLNVSSITDNSTGTYTTNFTSNMDSINYSLTVQVGGDAARNWVNSPIQNRSSSSVNTYTYNTSGTVTDYDSNNNTVSGDLA